MDSRLTIDYGESLDEALNQIDLQLDCKIFTRVTDGRLDVEIVSGAIDSAEPSHAADAYLKGTGALIVIRRPMDSREMMLHLVHELGHVIGLAHDERGIMAAESYKQPIARFTDKDRAAINERYCAK